VLLFLAIAGCQSSRRPSLSFSQSEKPLAKPAFKTENLAVDLKRQQVVDAIESTHLEKRGEPQAANHPSSRSIGLVGYQSVEEEPDVSPIAPSEDADAESELTSEAEEQTEQAPPEPTEISDSTALDSASPFSDDFGQTAAETGISLDAVLRSVAECYPEINIAIGELESASGKTLASWGEFDSVASLHSISQPLGFYQTYRNGVGISRPLYSGGEVYGTYRIGDGNFEPWYGERETNEAGEFKVGFDLPLLKDRSIDKRRAGVQSAQLQQQQLSANVETRLLNFERAATQAYWDWVASGQVVSIQQQLLDLAETRIDQVDKRMAAGDLAAIAGIDNNRFIAKRKNGLIKARRGLEKAAIKLSMFYRDANCQPVIASAENLPTSFPSENLLPEQQILNDIQTALASRPELQELAAARQEAVVKLEYANNLLLPKLNIKGFAGQDIGGETSSSGDKTPFELNLGVFGEVPIERRKGAGKIEEAKGKILQIDAKRQLVSNKIQASIQDAASAVNNAAEQIQQSRENVQLTAQSLRLGRLSFEAGDIDLLALNIYESSIADAKLQLLEAQYKYFSSLAKYETMVRNQAFIGEVATSN